MRIPTTVGAIYVADAAADLLCGECVAELTADDIHRTFLEDFLGEPGSNLRIKDEETSFLFIQFLADCVGGSK